ncbi:hypothetical protein ACFL27_10845 [candidate division CSSED10-310 bacterium]|uniref:Uncharacterized protein n=1 Tax=candidate division CSSED10-310 bacterium TaxID=2855610 RepID=A0ABV6YX72_UNCC1
MKQKIIRKEGRFTYKYNVFGTVQLIQMILQDEKQKNHMPGSGNVYHLQFCLNGRITGSETFKTIEKAVEYAQKVCQDLIWFDKLKVKLDRNVRLTDKGSAEIPDDWKLTEKQVMAIKRLAEIGCNVGPMLQNTYCVRVIVPFNLHADVFVEIGYLFARLSYDDFPDHYSPIADLYTRSTLFNKNNITPAVSARDSVPDGFRFYITLTPVDS